MNKSEYELLKVVWRDKPILGLDDLSDTSNRTLLWGYTCERDSWHVYIEDGEIHTVMYGYNDMLKHYHSCCATDNPSDWIPDKRLYPEACDYEFCKLLKEYGYSLPFTTWNDDRAAQQYHGKTLSELKEKL